MSQTNLIRAAVVSSGVVFASVFDKKNEGHKSSCSPGTPSINESPMLLEIEKQQQRITQKLISGESDKVEEQKLLRLMDSVISGKTSASDGIEKVRQSMFQKYQTTYDQHPCGKALQGWHDCFFDKMLNKNESSNGDKDVLVECKDPQLLALQLCMFQQTEKVKAIIRANMGDDAYEEWYRRDKRNALRKIHAASTNRAEKDVDESEIDKLYEESLQKRQKLETELNEFQMRHEAANSKTETERTSNIQQKQTEQSSWWKFGRK